MPFLCSDNQCVKSPEHCTPILDNLSVTCSRDAPYFCSQDNQCAKTPANCPSTSDDLSCLELQKDDKADWCAHLPEASLMICPDRSISTS